MKTHKSLFLIMTGFLSLFLIFHSVSALKIDYSQEINDLQKKIDEQQRYIEDLEKQKKTYKEKIELKRKEAVNLKNQIDLLTDQIAQREIEIQGKESKITAINFSIKKIQLKILEKKQEIDESSSNLKNVLRTINQYDQKSATEIILANNSISEVLNHLRYLNTLQQELNDYLTKIELLKEGLEIQEKEMRTNLQELTTLKNELKDKKAKLAAEKEAKQAILDQTRGAEWKFQSLLAEIITEQQELENEIEGLEKSIRKKIAEEKEKKAELMEKEGTIVFSWPVPLEGITCSFHDLDYPYRNWIGEHSGIDLRAEQGTSVRAAASGYVARAKHGGLGYSYVMIIHNESFSSIYGHLSKILVEEGEYVKRGSIIGKSGGLPGTSGAGKFSTGPHLHFEVRLNGIPVNPEEYLL